MTWLMRDFGVPRRVCTPCHIFGLGCASSHSLVSLGRVFLACTDEHRPAVSDEISPARARAIHEASTALESMAGRSFQRTSLC